MSFTNPTIVSAPTSYTVTGGTAVVFADSGASRQNEKLLIVPADTDFRTRRSILFRSSAAIPNKGMPNGYSNEKRTATIHKPIVLANGKMTVLSASITLSYDVEASVAQRTEMKDLAAQLLVRSSDFDAFWLNGQLA